MTQQLGFAGMPRRLYSAAPTRLTSFLDCPRRYRMTYLDRPSPPKGPPWAHNSVGAAVHSALAAWWKLPVAARTVPNAGRLLEDCWLGEGFRDQAQAARHRLRAREMVERYVGEVDPTDEPVGVERVVALRTERTALWGRVDRIDDRVDGLVVVDYKTGRHPPSEEDARTSLAMAVYAAAASRTLRRPCRRVELHHLPSGEVAGWEHTEESLARQIRRADSLAADVSEVDAVYGAQLGDDRVDEVFPPRVGPICGWCDFNRTCAEGNAARAPLPSWAGLPDV
ncbi:MAG: RecB family exonuclease [Nocardioidaceae bacterium]